MPRAVTAAGTWTICHALTHEDVEGVSRFWATLGAIFGLIEHPEPRSKAWSLSSVLAEASVDVAGSLRGR